MNHSRLAIITRRFWPVCGLVELAVGELACKLKSMGHEVEILTARWEKSWPKQFLYREVMAYRLPKPNLHPWGNHRFQKAIAQHIDQRFQQGQPIDGAIVFGMGPETEGLLRHVEKNQYSTKVLTRIDSNLEPYHRWTQAAQRKVLNSLNRTHGVIADSEFTVKNLLRFVEQDKIHYIPDGVTECLAERSIVRKSRARQSLSDAHPILSIEPEQQLVITSAPMNNDGGMIDLVHAWAEVLKAYPRAKLWMLGEGSHTQLIWNAITGNSLVHSIILPGFFDDLETILAAADLYVHPLRVESGCNGLLRAMADKVCPVATINDFTNHVIEAEKTGIMVPAGDPSALASGIMRGLENADLRKYLGHEATKQVVKKFSLGDSATKLLKLLSPTPSPAKPAHRPHSSQQSQKTR